MEEAHSTHLLLLPTTQTTVTTKDQRSSILSDTVFAISLNIALKKTLISRLLPDLPIYTSHHGSALGS
jgi:hypothetical protein